VRPALKRPNNRKRAKSPKIRGQSPSIAERRRLLRGSSTPGPPVSSWTTPLFRGTQPFGSPSGGKRLILLRSYSSPSFCLVTWRGSEPFDNGPVHVIEEKSGHGKTKILPCSGFLFHTRLSIIFILMILSLLLCRSPNKSLWLRSGRRTLGKR